ncbi:hypothetical protein C0J52_20320 [Blattella germanica]|nr:hypothetical protein C0J52_20320 [Blattella germanica]
MVNLFRSDSCLDSPSLKYFPFDEPKEGNVPITIKTKFTFTGDELVKETKSSNTFRVLNNLLDSMRKVGNNHKGVVRINCEAKEYIALRTLWERLGLAVLLPESHPLVFVNHCTEKEFSRLPIVGASSAIHIQKRITGSISMGIKCYIVRLSLLLKCAAIWKIANYKSDYIIENKDSEIEFAFNIYVLYVKYTKKAANSKLGHPYMNFR